MPGTLTYPPTGPQIANGQITLDLFLRNPTRVQRAIEDITRARFVADFIFANGDAQGGAVIYDQLTELSLYGTRDVQSIAPGAEFPIVDVEDAQPIVDKVDKYGAMAKITYEAVRRNSRDTLTRGLGKIRNMVIRKTDQRAIARLNSTLTGLAGGMGTITVPLLWTDPTSDPLADLFEAVGRIDAWDLGYTADTILINPLDMTALISHKEVRAALPRESTTSNPVVTGRLGGLAGITNWVTSNRVTAG